MMASTRTRIEIGHLSFLPSRHARCRPEPVHTPLLLSSQGLEGLGFGAVNREGAPLTITLGVVEGLCSALKRDESRF
jgi:hypothetical protein